jgi:hypothetical protein
MKVEVARLKQMAWRRMHLTLLLIHKERHVSATLSQARAIRVLRHWRVLTHFKRQRRARREEAVALITARRRATLFDAWRLVAAIRAEHGRIVQMARVRAGRRMARAALGAMRGAVLHSARKKMQLLSAALHWEGSMKRRALVGWRVRCVYWRHKKQAWEMSALHHRTRLLDAAFFAWLGQWQAYQVSRRAPWRRICWSEQRLQLHCHTCHSQPVMCQG